MSDYYLETFPVGSFQCNCTLIIHKKNNTAIVVDPGDDADIIEERLLHHNAVPVALWHTHAHIDHIGATKQLHDFFIQKNKASGHEAPVVYLHDADSPLYFNVAMQASFLGLMPFDVLPTFEKITDGQKYSSFEGLSAIHTPGHTPGSCCLKLNAKSELNIKRSFTDNSFDLQKLNRVILSGDTIFRQSIGRTDLWGGDHELILKNIKNKIFTLPDDSLIIPGHGPLTHVAREKESNPFF